METSSGDWGGDGQHWRITPRSWDCAPLTPGKAQQSRKAGLRVSSSLKSSQEVWGRGEPLAPVLSAREGEEEPQWQQVSELSHSCSRTDGVGRSWPGLRGRASAWAERARRHGGTGPVQRAGHPAAVLPALAGRGLESGQGV